MDSSFSMKKQMWIDFACQPFLGEGDNGLLPGFWIVPIISAFVTSNNSQKKVWVTFKPSLKISAELHAMLFLLLAENLQAQTLWKSVSCLFHHTKSF